MGTPPSEMLGCYILGFSVILLFIWGHAQYRKDLLKKSNKKIDYSFFDITKSKIKSTSDTDITTYEIDSKRYYFDIPYVENNEAMNRGAQWDSAQGQWYVVGSKVKQSFSKWVESITKDQPACFDFAEDDKRYYVDVSYSLKELAKEYGAIWDEAKGRWYVVGFYAYESFLLWYEDEKANEKNYLEDTKVNEKTFLNVPYIEHESAKYLGAKWDKAFNKWYITDPNQIPYFFRWIPYSLDIPYSTIPSSSGILYFDVPRTEEKIIESLGAKRDSMRDRWFITDRNGYHYFAKWLKGFYVICDHLYIVKGWKYCYKCRKRTPVIAFGLESFFDFSTYGIHEYVPSLWLASKIAPLPEGLQTALKDLYNFYISSPEKGANHCKYCGRLLGDYYLFRDFDGPFFIGFDEDERRKELAFYKVSLPEDILITGNFEECVKNTSLYEFVENRSLKWE